MYEEEVRASAQKLWQEGLRTLRWSANPMSSEAPWAESWVDVYVEELCQDLSTNWLLTILSPKDRDPADEGVIKVRPEAAILVRFGSDRPRKFYLLPGDQPLAVAGEDSDFYWDLYRQERFRLDEQTYRIPVWSRAQVELVTEEWIEQVSGRKFELVFSPESESPLHAEVQAAAEALRSGQTETFDLGDGIQATSEALDGLLQNPEMAAEIMAQLKDLGR